MVHHLFAVQGKWITSAYRNTIVDPLNGESFIKVSEVDETGIKVFILHVSDVNQIAMFPIKRSARTLFIKPGLFTRFFFVFPLSRIF